MTVAVAFLFMGQSDSAIDTTDGDCTSPFGFQIRRPAIWFKSEFAGIP